MGEAPCVRDGLGGLAALAIAGATSARGASTTDSPPPKVFVCKYVGKPGVDERLQTGDNPINPSASSIPGWDGENPGNLVGLEFADAQGRSVVIAIDVGQDEPDVSSCPPPTTPPPTDVCPNIDGNQATAPAGTVKDEHGNCVTLPPPPTGTTVTTDEFMDVQVTKDATPQVQLVNGQADIAYTIRVRNNGPNQAHNVVLMDAAPSGVTFLAVTLVGGNCTVTAALLNCTLDTIGPGVERTIELSARVTQTGTYVNSATGTGDGKDTNGANNTDDASTLVTAPVTPPTATPKPKPPVAPKPKPKPVANICRVLKVTPGMVRASGKARCARRVTRSRNPVSGVAVGSPAGHRQCGRRAGHRPSVMRRAGGIMLVKTRARGVNSARIGVIGVLTAGDRLGTLR
jgi:uncharacterized repeat protein (TIGR01451 family)